METSCPMCDSPVCMVCGGCDICGICECFGIEELDDFEEETGT